MKDPTENIDAIEHAHPATHVDLNNNITAKIQNPLSGLEEETLLRDVGEFAQTYGLTDILPLLEKGALVAADPENFESVEKLDEEDKVALRYEVAHRWSHPRTLYLTIITCSIGAAVQGWDQTGSNGANLSFPQEFGIGEGENKASPHYDRDNWLVGLVNAAPYIGSAFLGCWMSDPVNKWVGRRGAIFISALICIATPLGGAFSKSWEGLFASRIVMGIGMGLKGSTVPIFAAENSPAMIRVHWLCPGKCGLRLNLVVIDTGKIAWRLQIGSAFIPALPLAVLIYFCPESPRWLMKRGEYRKAYDSLCRLRKHDLFAARDLYFIDCQLKIEAAIVGKSNYMTRITQLFTVPRLRRATLASFVVMIAQQMCVGQQSGPSTHLVDDPFFFSPSLKWPGLSLLPVSASSSTRSPPPTLPLSPPSSTSSQPSTPPEKDQSPGPTPPKSSPSPTVKLAWAGPSQPVFSGLPCSPSPSPKSSKSFSPTGAFGFYAGLNVLAFIMIFFFVPETKQRTLEELDYIFAIPTRTFINYQVTKAFPYFVQRYIFMRKNAVLEPLYHFDQTADYKTPDSKFSARPEQIEKGGQE
ncbi:hypothetical protein DID88_009174 [Monilinia fructigena]|uniref:Major facilitator superfamily (MFS) profile domain-containing protein n=1 Tax=Monilinia fructigena TaxID=38457 RepID=A0A395IK37_9HELO|nr:hypothetical protein DID88_009174 [Monilinia fructigena]